MDVQDLDEELENFGGDLKKAELLKYENYTNKLLVFFLIYNKTYDFFNF